MASIKEDNFIQLAKSFQSFVKSIEISMSEKELEIFTYQAFLTVLNRKWQSLNSSYWESHSQTLAENVVESSPVNGSHIYESYKSAEAHFNLCRSAIYEQFSVARNSTTDPFWLKRHPTLVDELLDGPHDRQSHEKEQPFSHSEKKAGTPQISSDGYINSNLTNNSTDQTVVEVPSLDCFDGSTSKAASAPNFINFFEVGAETLSDQKEADSINPESHQLPVRLGRSYLQISQLADGISLQSRKDLFLRPIESIFTYKVCPLRSFDEKFLDSIVNATSISTIFGLKAIDVKITLQGFEDLAILSLPFNPQLFSRVLISNSLSGEDLHLLQNFSGFQTAAGFLCSVPLKGKPNIIKIPFNYADPSFGLLFVVQTNLVAQSLYGHDIYKLLTAHTEHKLQSTNWLKERQSDKLAGTNWLKERQSDFGKRGTLTLRLAQYSHKLKSFNNFIKTTKLLASVLNKQNKRAFAVSFFTESLVARSRQETPRALAFLWRFSVRYKSDIPEFF